MPDVNLGNEEYRGTMQILDTKTDATAREPASDRLVDILRADVLTGRFGHDSRLVEDAIARERGLSRTPVRHALLALEQEGLLYRLPRRGYRVRSFTIDEVADAIEVRGELEAMAARLHAERGWEGETRLALLAVAERGATLFGSRRITEAQQHEWAALNLEFHDLLVHGTSNIGLVTAYEQVKRIPLVSPRAILFHRDDGELTRRQIGAAQSDHERVIRAIDERRGQRASEIMRDHAVRSGTTKRQNYSAVLANTLLVADLGAALVTA